MSSGFVITTMKAYEAGCMRDTGDTKTVNVTARWISIMRKAIIIMQNISRNEVLVSI
jgi:hypothetical protein